MTRVGSGMSGWLVGDRTARTGRSCCPARSAFTWWTAWGRLRSASGPAAANSRASEKDLNPPPKGGKLVCRRDHPLGDPQLHHHHHKNLVSRISSQESQESHTFSSHLKNRGPGRAGRQDVSRPGLLSK